jgi:hypothetical protein
VRKNNYAEKYRKLKSGKIVRRGKCRLIFQGGEPLDRAGLKSRPKQRKEICTEEKKKQGSSKTLWGRKAFLRDMRK